MRLREFAASVSDLVKLGALILTTLGFVAAVARAVVYLSTRADATEVAVIQSVQKQDHVILMYMVHRIDDMAAQMNHQALTGKVPYVVPPSPPPELFGPQPQ